MNPDLKQNLQIKLFFEKKFFYIGDPIEGKLILISERPSIIEKITFEISCIQSWKYNSKSPFVFKEKIETIELDLSHASSLNPIQGCYVMPGGENIIPFKFKISNNINPCFEYPLGDIYAYLRYSFDVQIYSTSFNNTFSSFNLALYQRPSIDNKNKLLSKSITKTLKKWGLISIGTTVLTASIPDNNLKYDDSSFKMIIYIDNTNGKETTKEIKVKFTRIIEFINQDRKIVYRDENIISSMNLPAHVSPRQNNYFECHLPLKENNIGRYAYNNSNICPYELKMPDINFFMPTLISNVISCKYELNISLSFDCYVSESTLPNISFPIFMVHQSTIEYLLELQKNKIDNNQINEIINIENKNDNNIITNSLIIENNNQMDAPIPQNIQKIDKDININNNEQSNNLIDNNINIIEDNKFWTNDGNSSIIMNNNSGNNVNYNFNININNNLDSNKNNGNNIGEDYKKSIKESSFNLLDDNIYPDL